MPSPAPPWRVPTYPSYQQPNKPRAPPTALPRAQVSNPPRPRHWYTRPPSLGEACSKVCRARAGVRSGVRALGRGAAACGGSACGCFEDYRSW